SQACAYGEAHGTGGSRLSVFPPLMSFIGQFPNHFRIQTLNKSSDLSPLFFFVKLLPYYFGGDGDDNPNRLLPEFLPKPVFFPFYFLPGTSQDRQGFLPRLPDQCLFLLQSLLFCLFQEPVAVIGQLPVLRFPAIFQL